MNDNDKPLARPTGPAGRPRRATVPAKSVEEVGGRPGPEPTRYGDWEINGICSDF